MTQPPHIAIVEDDQAVRQSLTILMRALGYRASAYPSAETFLDAGRQGIPCIVMTAFPSDATRSASLAQGAVAYLAKPADGARIATLLAALFPDHA